MPMRSMRRLCLALVTAATCIEAALPLDLSAQLVSTAPLASNELSRGGIPYYVAMDVLDLTVVHSYSRTFVFDAGCKTPTEKRTPRGIQWSIEPRTIADASAVQLLALQPSGRLKQELTFTVTEAGLLRTVDYKVEDRAGQVLKNILRGTFGVIGTVSGFRRQNVYVDAGPGENSGPQCARDATDKAEGGTASFSSRIAGLEESLQKLSARRADILFGPERPLAAGDTSLLIALRRQDSLLARSEDMHRAALDRLSQIWKSKQAAWLKEKRAVDADTVERHFLTVSAEDLKADTCAQGTGFLHAKTIGVCLQLVPLANSTGAPIETHVDSEAKKELLSRIDKAAGCWDKAAAKGCALIRFRRPVPRMIAVWSADSNKGGKYTDFQERERMVLYLAAASDRVWEIAFRPTKFAEHKLVLALGPWGDVRGITQSMGSSAEGLTGAIADGLSDARNEAVAGVEAVKRFQEAQISISQNARTAELKALQDRKAILEAEIALSGTAASEEMLLEQQLLTAQIASLEKQRTLAATSEALNLAGEQEGLRRQLLQLQAEIDLLKKQLELRDLQEQLEKGSKP